MKRFLSQQLSPHPDLPLEGEGVPAANRQGLSPCKGEPKGVSTPFVSETTGCPIIVWAKLKLCSYDYHPGRSSLRSLAVIFFLSLFLNLMPKPAWSEEPKAARIPPLLWYEHDPEAKRTFIMALLTYWKYKDPSGQFVLLAPLYYNSKTPEEQLRILLPFHFKHSSKESESTLWGPYFYKKGLRESTRFVFPAYYHKKTPVSDLTLAGLYFRQKTLESSLRVVFPLYYSVDSYATRKAYQLFLPFYYKWRDLNKMTGILVSPLGYSYKDPQVSQGIVGNYYWHFTSSRSHQVGFPVYWRFSWQYEDQKTKDLEIAVPWFKYRKDNNSIRGFVPVYWGQKKEYQEENSTETLTKSWNLLFPLYYSLNKPNREKKVITPLFSRFEYPNGEKFGHTGLSFFSRDPWGGKTEGLVPIVYYREEPDFFKLRFLLLYLENSRDNLHRQISLFPVFRYRKDSDRLRFSTWGFMWDKDPIVSKGLVLAYFWRTERSPQDLGHQVVSRKRFLIPLYWDFKSETERTTVIPPLAAFHTDPDRQISLVAPFYYKMGTADNYLRIMFPVIQRRSPEKNWTGVFFVVWKSQKGARSAFTVLPFYRKSNFSTGYSIFLPGMYYLKDSSGTQGVALTYLWDYRGKTQYEMFPPFYLKFSRPTWSFRSVFPYYRLQTEGFDEKGLFPFWAKTKAVSVSTGTFKHYMADSHRLLPFYFYRKLENGYDLYLPFLLGHVERGLNEHKEPMVRGRLLLVNYWEKSPRHYLNRVDPVYSYYNTPSRKGFSIPTAPLPLWQYERLGIDSDDGEIVRGAFFPYYWKASGTVRRDFVVPLFYQKTEKDKETKKVESRNTWLLAYYSSRNYKELREKTFIVPLYWHFKDKDEQRTIVPPFWLEKGLNYERAIVFPVWWSFERDQAKTRLFFPLYFRSDDKTEQRSLTIAPGFWRKKDPESVSSLFLLYFQSHSIPEKGKTNVIFPLVWSSRYPGREATTVFPFFWRVKEDGRLITYLFPLYFQHKREHLDWKIAFPLFWSFKTDETKVSVVPPYFSVRSLKNGSRTTGFAPIWSYSRNPDIDWKSFQIFGGLFQYERKADQKKFTFLYLIQL